MDAYGRSGIWLVALVLLALAVGCARVKPYQRETLAHPCMQESPWPGVERGDLHVFSVREGTVGGSGNPGGGCGCN